MDKLVFVEESTNPTRIRVLGVGGGGCNAVDSMIGIGLNGVEFCNVNTDMQALSLSRCPNKLHIGEEVTNGMGCGGGNRGCPRGISIARRLTTCLPIRSPMLSHTRGR